MDSYLLRPTIKSLGHSGCEVKLIEKNGSRIQKRSSDREYNARLRKQINKQIDFKDDFVKTPQVLDVHTDEEGLLVAEMEYVNAADFSCYIEVKPIDDVLWLIEQLCKYVEGRMRFCRAKTPLKSVVETKLATVTEQIAANPVTAGMEDLVPKYGPLVAMPVGSCHGDLTFANILITRDDVIYLIDFLDSFVESPLIDIVKLRQDTRHYWSIRRNLNDIDKTKIELVFDRFDEIILETFADRPWWANYKFFQRLNLCRILPYVKDPNDAEYIKAELERV